MGTLAAHKAIPGRWRTCGGGPASAGDHRHMALPAEEIIEEWLSRKCYFAIRSVKVGVHEMDLLPVRFNAGGPVNAGLAREVLLQYAHQQDGLVVELRAVSSHGGEDAVSDTLQ